MSNPIQIWKFDDAPQKYRNLSPHGGDEDWVALVPREYAEEFLVQVFFTEDYQRSNPFGVSHIQKEILEDEDVLYIGAHA